MTAKEYLNQAYYIDREINLTLAKADKLRQSLYGRAVTHDSTAVQSSGDKDTLGRTFEKIDEYERKANEMIDRLVEKRIEIENTIKAVPDSVQREVLERRYLLFQEWDSGYDRNTGEYKKGIYEEMHFSRRQIFRIHGEALSVVSMALNGIEWH